MTAYLCRRLIPTTAFLLLFALSNFSCKAKKNYPSAKSASRQLPHFASRSYTSGHSNIFVQLTFNKTTVHKTDFKTSCVQFQMKIYEAVTVAAS